MALTRSPHSWQSFFLTLSPSLFPSFYILLLSDSLKEVIIRGLLALWRIAGTNKEIGKERHTDIKRLTSKAQHIKVTCQESVKSCRAGPGPFSTHLLAQIATQGLLSDGKYFRA